MAVLLAGAAGCLFPVVFIIVSLSQRIPGADDSRVSVLVGAGDIAGCESTADSETADLLDDIGGLVFTLGDNAYPAGTFEQFAACYDPTWGRHKARTRPVPGNHDYGTPNASGYFSYFGTAAGAPMQGYYAYDVSTWRVYALNSNCDEVGGCRPGSPQYDWLVSDLADRSAACVLAYWHHPLFSASPEGGYDAVGPFFEVLYEAGAEIVMSASSHSYERFAPLAPMGEIDQQYGIRQFVVGTGGAGLRTLGDPLPFSERQSDEAHGVLKLTLQPESYTWDFISSDAQFADTGEGTCHPPPGPAARESWSEKAADASPVGPASWLDSTPSVDGPRSVRQTSRAHAPHNGMGA